MLIFNFEAVGALSKFFSSLKGKEKLQSRFFCCGRNLCFKVVRGYSNLESEIVTTLGGLGFHGAGRMLCTLVK